MAGAGAPWTRSVPPASCSLLPTASPGFTALLVVTAATSHPCDSEAGRGGDKKQETELSSSSSGSRGEGTGWIGSWRGGGGNGRSE